MYIAIVSDSTSAPSDFVRLESQSDSDAWFEARELSDRDGLSLEGVFVEISSPQV